MAERFPNEYKTLWKKDELLVTTNSSFSHSVFKRLALQTRKNRGLFGEGLGKLCVKLLNFESEMEEIKFLPQPSTSTCTVNYKGKGSLFHVHV